MAMTLEQALEVLAEHRDDQVVITTMASAKAWPRFSDGPLDFVYVPSSMGQAPPLGLGLALAQPNRRVVVVNGDGCMLMNLGCLATIAEHPASLFLIVINNGLYEVTGGQPVVGAGRIDYAGIARSVGIERTYSFAAVDEWRNRAAEALSGPGPVFIQLDVAGRIGESSPKPRMPMAEQIARLRAGLGVS